MSTSGGGWGPHSLSRRRGGSDDGGPELTRKGLLGGATALVGGALAAGLPQEARPASSPAKDAKVLNFALLLEYLTAAFYTEAFANGALRGELSGFAEAVGAHERQHVAFLRKALGKAARPRPRFTFG